MRKIHEVLRLHFELQRSKREIARIIGASPTTVSDYLARAKLAGLRYPLPEGLTESALEQALFPSPEPSSVQRPMPNWQSVHNELRRKGVTLELLWQEYKAEQPDGFQYSAFCDRYRQWRQHLSLSMRQTHTPGEKLFIDYAGQTVPVTDGATGEIRPAQIFVAVLGASNYTFLEATWSQQLPDWIGSHVRALAFFGGSTELWVPDNLRSGVHKASRYEPDINPTYHDLAAHYGVAVLPARARRPKDKAKVENGVLVVSRLLQARRHPQQAYRSCLGVFRLGQEYGIQRLEAACARALAHNAVSWKSLQSILKNGLDLQGHPPQRRLDLPEHENVRGAAYYHSKHVH